MSKTASFHISSWFGVAGGIESQEDWSAWANHEQQLLAHLKKPELESVPGKVSRRLNVLGKSVLHCCEKCIPDCHPYSAVLAVSRHGDLASMDKIIECARNHDDISPTAFSYSVHNRFSSLVSMFAGYHGVNAAYSSVRDGFPLAISEAISLLNTDPEQTVLVLAYEPEIPKGYDNLIKQTWFPHVLAFVLKDSNTEQENIRLARHATSVEVTSESGTGLVFLRAMLRAEFVRDGFWEYQVER